MVANRLADTPTEATRPAPRRKPGKKKPAPGKRAKELLAAMADLGRALRALAAVERHPDARRWAARPWNRDVNDLAEAVCTLQSMLGSVAEEYAEATNDAAG